ncbi:WxL protein peptidoglycan domain-containing protein [Bacillus sp. AFS051223]
MNNATTNSNGIVDYTQSKFKKDPSMKLDLKDLIKNDSPQLTVGGHQ